MRFPQLSKFLFPIVFFCTSTFGASPDTHEKIAARFAPVFLQETGKGDNARYDYPTRADFDGDWNATNDWRHAKHYPLPAYVYYSILETKDAYFIHYAVFHPRDWKGGALWTALLSNFRHVTKFIDPSRAILDAALSHENDLEGVLIVVAKEPEPRVIFGETLAHSVFTKFASAEYLGKHLRLPQNVHLLTVEDGRPVFSVESKGHGIRDPRGREPERVLTYRFTGVAEDPARRIRDEVGYDLLSIHETFWELSPRDAKRMSTKFRDYSKDPVSILGTDGVPRVEHICGNPVGTHFRGHVGARNYASFPWGWRSVTWKKFLFWNFDHDQPYPGAWFFDPARTVKKHFLLADDFSTAYIYHPYVECEPHDK